VPGQCRNRTTVGIDRHDGAFADYMTLTDDNLHTVPTTISDDQAVFTEPLAAALHILQSTHISPEDSVVVIGAGKLGMLAAQAIKLTGAELSVVVRRDKQANLLEKWGIQSVTKDDLRANRASVVVDCTGVPGGFSDALDLVRPRGTLVLKSTYEGLLEADLTRVVVDEIRVIGSRCGNFRAALDVLKAGLVDVESLIEARYAFDDIDKAFDHATQRGVFKVLVDF
jgi:threonine dehydrogenase-like Zn-dependent dehydrogenase